MKTVKIGSVELGAPDTPFVLISGPCVIEDETTTLTIAEILKEITERLSIPLIFKASYDKANRTSADSFRGPGLKAGLKILDRVRREFDVPVLTDVHSIVETLEAAATVDCLQIPAFLCRQTDILVEAGKSGKAVNIKKGQFMAPEAMEETIKKVTGTGNENVFMTERGTTFGYGNLIVDFRSLPIMRDNGYPVIFDATHSVQKPSALGKVSGGDREMAKVLSRAAVAVGCDGLFMETHPEPEKALSDGPNSIRLGDMESLLKRLLKIHAAAREE